MERFLEGLTDCCRVDSNTLGQLSGGKTSLLTFRNGTVSLLLNQASPSWRRRPCGRHCVTASRWRSMPRAVIARFLRIRRQHHSRRRPPVR